MEGFEDMSNHRGALHESTKEYGNEWPVNEQDEGENELMEEINPSDMIQGNPEGQNGCEFDSDDMIEASLIDEENAESGHGKSNENAEVFFISAESAHSDETGAIGTVHSADDYTGFMKLKQYCTDMAKDNPAPEPVDPVAGTRQMLDAIKMMEKDKQDEVNNDKPKPEAKKDKSKSKSKKKSKKSSSKKEKRRASDLRCLQSLLPVELEKDDSLPGGLSYLLPPESGKMADIIGVRCDDERMEAGKIFGPYGGDIIDEVEGCMAENAWELCLVGHVFFYTKGNEENWMSHVRCACTEAEQNLEAFQMNGDVYFRTTKVIYNGTELRVMYSEEYANLVGFQAQFNDLKYLADKRTFECTYCSLELPSAKHMLRHLKLSHEVTEATDVPVISWKPKDSSPIKAPVEIALEDIGQVIKQKRQVPRKAPAPSKKQQMPEDFTCVSCGKSFPTEGILNQHVKFHEFGPEHSCKVCGESQMNHFMLQRHMKNHENRPVKCSLCPKAYFTRNALHAHERKIHGRMKNIQYICRLCSKIFRLQKELVKHEKDHDAEEGLEILDEDLQDTGDGNEPEYKCKHCAKVCVSIHALQGHLKRFHGRLRVMQYGCKLCTATFRSIRDFLVHEDVHLNRRPRTEVEVEELPQPKRKKVEKVRAPHDLFYCKCKECPKKCHTKGGIYSHVQKHHDGMQVLHFTCRICKVLIEFKQDMVKHVTQAHGHMIERGASMNSSYSDYDDQDYQDNESNDMYSEADGLDDMGSYANQDRESSEMMNNSEESSSYDSDGSYVSDEELSAEYGGSMQAGQQHSAPEAFLQENGNRLENDMLGKRVDLPDKAFPFRCEFCQKGYREKQRLIQHQAEVHFGSATYKCPYCPRQFMWKSRFNTHVNHHEAHRLFKCEECPRGFASEGALKNHQQEHTGEKPIKCPTCDRGFSSDSLMQAHVKRMHTVVERNHSCQHCSKSFTNNSDLVRHERRHMGYRPFKCETCGKAFTANHTLQLHVKAVHDKDKGLACTICGRKFAINSNLYEHMSRCQMRNVQQQQLQAH